LSVIKIKGGILMMDIIKKINNDKDYNNFFVRATGIFIVILFINLYGNIFDKYGYLIGFFITVPTSFIIYILWVFSVGYLYKKLK